MAPPGSDAVAEPFRLAPLTPAHAGELVTWRYEPPYNCYDLTGAEPAELMDPASGFHAVLAGERLVGFRSFGVDGQVPGWDYDDSALDTGGGLDPRLVGHGLGAATTTAGLDFGREAFAPAAFRVTVASFNQRALTVVRRLGFEPVGRFEADRDGRSFEVLVRPE